MDSSETYSIHVSNTLDCMGYNRNMINYRVLKYKEFSDLLTGPMLEGRIIIVGSKGEGLSAPMKSDKDMMVVFERVACDAYPNQHDTVFEMDTRDSPPGYTKLKLINTIEDDSVVNSLVRFGYRGWYISSEIYLKYNVLSGFLEGAENTDNVFCMDVSSISQSGPAATRIIHNCGNKLNNDVVPSFPCRHYSLLESWKNRHRDHIWPPLELVMNIQNTDIGYVVPVGLKGNDNQHLDWRICFTTIEQKLIHSFNDTQTKLYVLLKMIAKEIIQPIFEDITSYVMKNIVLWMAELVHEEQFRDHLLIDRLMQALHYLKHCVKKNCLPSYMIPERNLIARKLTYSQRLKLADILSEIISHGEAILFTCEKIKLFTLCMYKIPHQTRRFVLKREMIEKLYQLQMDTVISLLLKPRVNMLYLNLTQYLEIVCNNQLVYTISKVLNELVIPEWRVFVDRGKNFETLQQYYAQRLYNYLS